MNSRVQSLDPASEHLRSARDVGHVQDLEPRILQSRGRAAAAHESQADVRQTLGQRNQTSLV